MIRNHDQYFFDAQAFENIIDYYIEKNDPVKAIQVVRVCPQPASLRRRFSYIKQAQLFVVTNRIAADAFAALEQGGNPGGDPMRISILSAVIYTKALSATR